VNGERSGNGLTGAWVPNLFNRVVDEAGVLVFRLASGATDTIDFLGQQTASQDPLGDVYVSFGGPLDVVSAHQQRIHTLGPVASRRAASAELVW
jgi:hypothetical protein